MPSTSPSSGDADADDHDHHDDDGRGDGRLGMRLALGVLLLAAVAATTTTGCARGLVKAHQRELLADRIMRLDGETQERAADEHVLSNREGSIGGTGTAGGGCGCN